MKDAKIIAPTTIKPSLFYDTQRCKICKVQKNKLPYMHSCTRNKQNTIATFYTILKQYTKELSNSPIKILPLNI